MISVALCSTSQAASLFYTDYVNALTAPAKPDHELFVDSQVDKIRLVNILFSQSQNVSRETIDAFVENVDVLLSRTDMTPWHSELQKAKVNALMMTGRYQEAIESIDALSHQEQVPFGLLQTLAFWQLGDLEHALLSFNHTEVCHEELRQCLTLAQDLVINAGIKSDQIHLPDDGDKRLVNNLTVFYVENKAYEKAYNEQLRTVDWEDDLIAKQQRRSELVGFAVKYDLIAKEIATMKSYLEHNDELPQIPAEFNANVNRFTNKLVRYYSDPRNPEHQEPQQVEPLLASQKRLSRTDDETRIAYLENRIYLYRKAHHGSFYDDINELAILTQDKSLIASVYNKSLPNSSRQKLLDTYFAIALPYKDDVFMAQQTLPFVSSCSSQTPLLIRALKGHEWVQKSELERAYDCFGELGVEQLPLSPDLKQTLNTEKQQVAYVHAKQQGDTTQALALAKTSNDAKMKYDALLLLLESKDTLSEADIKHLDTLRTEFSLTAAQNDHVDSEILLQLRKQNDRQLLMAYLKRAPERNALELAYLFIDDDALGEAFHYIELRVQQASPLNDYDNVKIVRYLDTYYPYLSDQQRHRLRIVQNSALSTLSQLHDIQHEIAQSFKVDEQMPLLDAVQATLTEYSRLDTQLATSVTEPNYTVQLWLQAELSLKLEQVFSQLAQNAPVEMAQVLNSKINELHAQRQDKLRHILSLKIEGITDGRIVEALQALQEKA
ncbi:TPA: hypothetical protein ACGTRQ_003800 [Vibrio parahaemolyticus]